VRKVVDQQALEPLRTALLARAREEAEVCVAHMRSRTASELDAASAAADQAVQDARLRGETEAATAVAIEDATVRRQVRTLLLAARRSVYEQLRTHIQDDVRQLHGEPIYGALRDTMTSVGRSLIGPDATVREVDDGCVIEASGRRVEVTLESLADWALDAVLADSQGWTP
jgi:vacuolar-type H+-ATPase subunit E/Vma4